MQEDLHICEKFRNFVGFFVVCVYIRSARSRVEYEQSNS